MIFFFKSFDHLRNKDIPPFFEKRIGATCLSLVFTKFHQEITFENMQKHLVTPSQGIFGSAFLFCPNESYLIFSNFILIKYESLFR